jgi:hypothetical protein
MVTYIKHPWSLTVALGCTLLMTGCASAPPPTEQIAVSESAVNDAVSAGSTETAPVETKAAHDKLGRAKQLLAAKDDKAYVTARSLAEEAEVDAKLAETKARSAKAQGAVNAIQDDIRMLNEEIERQQKNR